MRFTMRGRPRLGQADVMKVMAGLGSGRALQQENYNLKKKVDCA